MGILLVQWIILVDFYLINILIVSKRTNLFNFEKMKLNDAIKSETSYIVYVFD